MFKNKKQNFQNLSDNDNSGVIDISSARKKFYAKQTNKKNNVHIKTQTFKKLSFKDYVMFILFVALCLYLFYLCSSPM